MPRTGPTGQQFSYGQLEGLWIAQGGPPRLAPIMAAIAMAESGGRSNAQNPSGASGLWQILGNPFPGNPFDPATNARMAVAKWKSQGLGAWVTYTSGAYQKYLKRGIAPVTPGGSATAGIPYGNPLRGVKGLTAGRIDMGVDYSGQGPVYALGPGVITYAGTGNTGWGPPAGIAPGGYVKERLTAGPLSGHSVYVAEGIQPSVRVGQRVTSGTVIGQMQSAIETGFAAPGAGTAAAGQSQFSGSNATAYGVAYSRLLSELGAPAGAGASATVGGTGSGPGWPPSWLRGVWSGLENFASGGANVANSLTGLGGIAGAINNIANWLTGLTTAIDWLLNPANWVRIIAGVGGGVLVLGGIYTLSHVGGSVQVPSPGGGTAQVRPAALPVGILMVGSGGVLLFIAFHNLPGSPANIGEVLGSVRDSAQAAAAGQGASATVGG